MVLSGLQCSNRTRREVLRHLVRTADVLQRRKTEPSTSAAGNTTASSKLRDQIAPQCQCERTASASSSPGYRYIGDSWWRSRLGFSAGAAASHRVGSSGSDCECSRGRPIARIVAAASRWVDTKTSSPGSAHAGSPWVAAVTQACTQIWPTFEPGARRSGLGTRKRSNRVPGSNAACKYDVWPTDSESSTVRGRVSPGPYWRAER